jgi:hypothetical protein
MRIPQVAALLTLSLVSLCVPLAGCEDDSQGTSLTRRRTGSKPGPADDGDDDGTGASDGSPTGSKGGGAGSSGGNGAGTGGAPKEPERELALADGVRVDRVSVLQALTQDLFKDGQRVAQRSVPLIQKRPTLVRVYASSAGASPASLEARLTIEAAGARVARLTQPVTLGAPKEDQLGSTINFEITGDQLPAGASISVGIFDTQKPQGAQVASSPARFPVDGSTDPLDLQRTGTMKIVLVPVRYNADGSGRMPDITPAQVERLKKTMFARYPLEGVDLTVRAPMNFAQTVSAGGGGWSALLNSVLQLRAQDNAAPDVYYYGIFSPAQSFTAYCNGSCVAGLSPLNENSDSEMQGSIGLGYTGDDTGSTMAHEIGHAHGRPHAPCGATANDDPNFPYQNGGIGPFGYHIVDKVLFSPVKYRDMMSYCTPDWLSDYTYKQLLGRVKQVTKPLAPSFSGAAPMAHVFSVDALGNAEHLTDTVASLAATPALEHAEHVTYVDDNGATLGETQGHMVKLDHLPGGYLIVPKAPGAAKALDLGQGRRVRLRGR